MSPQNKHILLISYVFPPYYGIGGRRWSKHADALTKLGYTIHVICARNPYAKESLWYDLVKKNPRIIVHQLPACYPKALLNYSHNSLLSKITYRFWVMALLLTTRGSIFDRSVFWKKPMLKKASQLISEFGIRQVICTGGPFGAMYYSTCLKKTFKDLFLVNDLRDPWTWASNWGYSSLSPQRMAFEKKIEALTMERSDLITVPGAEMLGYLQAHYPQFKHKMVEVPHFYDPAELCALAKTSSSKIRLVYYGTLYQDIAFLLENVAKVLSAHPDKFSLDIYSDQEKYREIFEKHQAANVRYFPPLKLELLFKKFQDYDFVFIPTPDYTKNNISTKFYEIIYSKTPMIIYSNKGKAGDFVEETGVGVWIAPASLEEKLLKLHRDGDFVFNTRFDISRFSIDAVAAQIDGLLQHGTGTKPL